jgi:acyl-ACP thioesterase
MEQWAVWEEPTYVRSFETDFRSRWKPAAFFAAMQEAATHHAAHLGFDYPDMIANNQIWLLSRMKIQFERFPMVSQAVTVRTWPRGVRQKILFIREFEFLNADGQRLAAATSGWLLIDVQARRLLPQGHLNGALPGNEERVGLNDPLDKIVVPAELPTCRTYLAEYAAVDMMGHVNNTRYVEWVSDCFSFEHHREHELRWLQMNYVNEVKPGETVAVGVMEGQGGAWVAAGTNQETGQRAFECAVGWE